MEKKNKNFIIKFLIISAGWLLFAIFIRGFSFKYIVPSVFFLVCVVASELIDITLPQGGSISVSFAFVLTALLVFPLPAVVSIAAAGILIAEIVKNKKIIIGEVLLSVARISVVVVSSGFIFRLLGGEIGNIHLFSKDLIPLIGTSINYFFVDVTLGQVVLSLKKQVPLFPSWRGTIKLLGLVHIALSSIGILMALMFKDMSYWGALLFFLPLAVTRHSFKLYIDIKIAYRDTIEALASAIEAQNPRRRGHARRVSEIAVDIARELGIHGDELEVISYAALLHDVGKLGLEEESVNIYLSEEKTYELKDLEEEATHALMGAEIIEQIEHLKGISDIVRYHHKPFAKKGTRIKKEKIPIGARIINAASCFDELTYIAQESEKITPKEAFTKMKTAQGSLFDPKVIRAFMKVLRRQGKILILF